MTSVFENTTCKYHMSVTDEQSANRFCKIYQQFETFSEFSRRWPFARIPRGHFDLLTANNTWQKLVEHSHSYSSNCHV